MSGAVAFHYHILAQFGAHTEVSTNQHRRFLGAFEELHTKPFIDHHTNTVIHCSMIAFTAGRIDLNCDDTLKDTYVFVQCENEKISRVALEAVGLGGEKNGQP